MALAGMLAVGGLALGLLSTDAPREAAAAPGLPAGSLGLASDRGWKPSPAYVKAIRRIQHAVGNAIREEEEAVEKAAEKTRGMPLVPLDSPGGAAELLVHSGAALLGAGEEARGINAFMLADLLWDVAKQDKELSERMLEEDLTQDPDLLASYRVAIRALLRKKRELIVRADTYLTLEPSTKPAPTQQVKAITAMMERALDRERQAIKYLEGYDASGNRVKAEKSIEQTIADLLEAGIIAERWDLPGIESNVSTALRGTTKALAEIEDDPPDIAAAKRHLQAAINATQAGIAVLEKLLKPATPKPKPSTPTSFKCSIRGDANGWVANSRERWLEVKIGCNAPVATVTLYTGGPMKIASATFKWQRHAHTGSCRLFDDLNLTCTFSPALANDSVIIEVIPGNPPGLPFGAEVKAKDGRSYFNQSIVPG